MLNDSANKLSLLSWILRFDGAVLVITADELHPFTKITETGLG